MWDIHNAYTDPETFSTVPATTGRAIIAANSDSVDLSIAAQAWTQILIILMSGETVQTAVQETNAWVIAQNFPGGAPQWSVIGDGTVKLK